MVIISDNFIIVIRYGDVNDFFAITGRFVVCKYFVENGNIIVNGADNAKIVVYSTNGQCVYNGTSTNILVSAKGIYIVKENNKLF